MIDVHATKRPNDVGLVAVAFTSTLDLPVIVRMVPEPLVESETRVLEVFGMGKESQTHVGYTPKRATGFPAWAILTDPDNAQHALNLVADVEWARRKAKVHSTRVRRRIDQLIGVLQASAPHFLPTFLEEFARIFAVVGKPRFAKHYFTRAREMERAHSLDVDRERNAQAFAEFAALGVVSGQAFSQEARAVATRMAPEEAYDYFFGLVINQAKSGAPLFAEVFRDLRKLGRNAGRSASAVEQELVASYVVTRGFPKSSKAVMKKIYAVMSKVLDAQPELAEFFYAHVLTDWDVDNHVKTLQKHDLWEPLCASPDVFARWFPTLITYGEQFWSFFEKPNRDLLDAIEANRDALAGTSVTIHSKDYHLDYLDVFTRAGVNWDPKPYNENWSQLDLFKFDGWFESHHRDLDFLITREDVRNALITSLPSEALQTHLDPLLAAQPTRTLVEWKLKSYCKQRAKATGSMTEWATLTEDSAFINDPRLRELYPELVAEITRIDPAEELAERIRRGTIVEYAWPAFEDNSDVADCFPTSKGVGFGPMYVEDDYGDDHVTILPSGEKLLREEFGRRFTLGTLAGLEIPDAVAVARSSGARFYFEGSFTLPVTSDTVQSPFGVHGDRLYGISMETELERWWYVSPLGTFCTEGEDEFYAIKKPYADVWFLRPGCWRHSAHMLYDAATDTRIAPALNHTGDKHGLNFLPPMALHQLHIRNEKVSAKMRRCTTEEAAQLLKNPAQIIEFAENDSVLAAAIAGMIVDISEIPLVSITLPVLEEVPQELEYLYSKLAAARELEPVEIPLPPRSLIDESGEDVSENFRQFALCLRDPQDSGELKIEYGCSSFFKTIGLEKMWLAWLATPGHCLDFVRFSSEFLHWCADYGLLGTWRRVHSPRTYPTAKWENKRLVSERHGDLLWNPDFSECLKKPLSEPSFNDDLFVPKTEFKQALDAIVAWHEKRHAGGNEKVPAWSDVTVEEAADRMAGMTTLPPRLWGCFFLGLYDDYDLHRCLPPTWVSGNIGERISEMLGCSVLDIDSVDGYAYEKFDNRCGIFRGLGWHENYLTEGPDCAAIGKEWARLWGEAKLHVSDDLWDLIPEQFHKDVGPCFHCEPPHYGGQTTWGVSGALHIYLHFAQVVEPGSEVAVAIAGRIDDVRHGVMPHPTLPLGCDYFSPSFEEPHRYYVLQLVKEGHLDSLMSYLRQGSLIAGAKQDPSNSAPDIVVDVVDTLGISTDAARYFLQLLALTRPMDTHVKKWNSWTKAQLNQARQELVDKDLVVTAKRAGTGRSVFLPGGWLEKSDTGPAMEVWKAPHYLLWKDAKCRPIVKTCPPLMPYPELFTEVWERYKSGDVPGYEELTTTRYRRKR